jgi:hypothetical protein
MHDSLDVVFYQCMYRMCCHLFVVVFRFSHMSSDKANIMVLMWDIPFCFMYKIKWHDSPTN